MRGSERIKLSLAVFALAAFSARAQIEIKPRPKPPIAGAGVGPITNLRVDASVVLVPVTVSDPLNRPVTGLEKQHFRIFDNDVEQTVTSFTEDDSPVAVGLVFDTSGSMRSKLRLSRQAATAFFGTANPDDEFFLVEFNDKPKLVVPLTRDVGAIQNHLASSRSRGRTSLLDALVLALHELNMSSKPRKALLIISDGGDNCSRYTERELRDRIRESDALIYAIGVYGGASSPEEMAGPGLLTEMAEQSGGRHFAAAPSEMPDIAAKIGIELRNRYVLGFSPSDQERDGRYHPVQVKILPPRGLPPLRASWRRGYYAPQE